MKSRGSRAFSESAAPDAGRGRPARLLDLALIYQTETPLAACFHEEESGPLFGGAAKPEDIWLPLAKIEIEGDRRRGAVVEVTLPEWLAREKGLV